MANYHPDHIQLAEFANGSLEPAISVCISAHLEYCSACRSTLQMLNQLGAALIQDQSSYQVSDDMEQALMEKIENQEDESDQNVNTTPDKKSDLPDVLNKLINENTLKWKKLSKSLDVARLQTGQNEYEMALHRINAGQRVIEHDHGGDEYTVILRGSFSDHYGLYREGDFVYRQAGDIHQPVATEDQDCLCLTAVSKPIRLTGLYSIVNPLLRLNPE